MIKKIRSYHQDPKPKLFELIDDYNFTELSSYIQDEKNEIWNILIEDNNNCLHYTCEKGNEKMIIFIITQLKIRLGINSNFITKNDTYDKNINLFKYFINSQTKSQGYTPLHNAILSFSSCIHNTPQQNINIIKFLLQNYSDTGIKTKSNQNVLHLCAISNNTNALVLFKEKYLIDINSKDNLLKTPLHYAAEKNSYDVLNILVNYENIEVNQIDKNGNTPIHYAINNNNLRSVKKLIQYHADLNIISKRNRNSPLKLGLNSNDKNIKNIFMKKSFFQNLFFEQTIKKGETNISKIIIFFSIHLFSFILNYFLLIPCYSNRYSILSILYITITSIIFIFYFVLFFSDPGYKDVSDSKYSSLLDVLEDKKDVVKYCPQTFILMEDNSRYCLICQKYIKGFNHHCYWVGNCIGELNFNKFMAFIILCICNIGYNLILIFIYFTSGILSKIFDLNKSFFNIDDGNDDINENEEIKNGEFNLMKGIRRISAIIGTYICFLFLMQLIELFKYHYKGMKERRIIYNKKTKYI